VQTVAAGDSGEIVIYEPLPDGEASKGIPGSAHGELSAHPSFS